MGVSQFRVFFFESADSYPSTADRSGGRGRGSQLLRRLREAEGDIRLYPLGALPSLALREDSPPHRPASNAVLAAFFSDNMMPRDIRAFVGTVRKQFSGDIVVAIHPNLKPDLLGLLKSYEVVIYEIPVSCKHDEYGERCTFMEIAGMLPIPLAQLRSVQLRSPNLIC